MKSEGEKVKIRPRGSEKLSKTNESMLKGHIN